MQPHGPYYIVGWSLGGTIAFEMVRQLEQGNNPIAFLALVDSPGPRKDDIKNLTPFTLESELNYIHSYLPGDKEITGQWKHVKDLNRIWPVMVDFLEEKKVDVDLIKNVIMRYERHALPNFDQLGMRESIYYLNVGRTLTNARAGYIPTASINTVLHYFKASQSSELFLNDWIHYCMNPIKSYEITGDHFSILKIPRVLEFAKILEKAMKLI